MKFDRFFKVKCLDQFGQTVALASPLHNNEKEANAWAEENSEKITTGMYEVIEVKAEVQEELEPVESDTGSEKHPQEGSE